MQGSINWEAVNAISNILMTIATFIAILTSLYFSRLSFLSKGKTFYEIDHDKVFKKYKFIIVNHGYVKIRIISFRLIIDNIGWKHKHIAVINEKLGIDLDSAQHYIKVIKKEEINTFLIKHGKLPGDRIKLRYVFMDSRNKFHTKTLNFEVYKESELTINPELNKSNN